MKQFKLGNKETIKDHLEYRRDYKVLDELTKDELIERYIYKLDNIPYKSFLAGVITMGLAFIVFRLTGLI